MEKAFRMGRPHRLHPVVFLQFQLRRSGNGRREPRDGNEIRMARSRVGAEFQKVMFPALLFVHASSTQTGVRDRHGDLHRQGIYTKNAASNIIEPILTGF